MREERSKNKDRIGALVGRQIEKLAGRWKEHVDSTILSLPYSTQPLDSSCWASRSRNPLPPSLSNWLIFGVPFQKFSWCDQKLMFALNYCPTWFLSGEAERGRKRERKCSERKLPTKVSGNTSFCPLVWNTDFVKLIKTRNTWNNFLFLYCFLLSIIFCLGSS